MTPPSATLDVAVQRGTGVRPVGGSDSGPTREAGEPSGRGPGLELVFSALFVLAGWWVGIRQLSDNSFFWHLRIGRYMLDHGVPHGDVFSYTAPGVHWVAQSWLAELTYGGLDRTFGPLAIRVLVALTGAAITLMTYRLARRLSGDRVRAGLLSVVAYLAVMVVFSERPLAFGLAFALVVVRIVEVPDARLSRRPLVALPVVLWFWVNVHGSFALGVVYIGLHVLGRWLDGEVPWRGRERDLVVGTLLGLTISFANPYGPGLLLFPVQLMGRGRVLAHVVEWQSPNFRSPVGIAFAAWLVVLVCALARSPRRPTRRDVLVAVPFVLMALWAERNIGLAVIFTLPIAARAFAATRKRPDVRSPVSAMGLLVVVSLIAVSGVAAAGQPDFQLRSYPSASMTYLQAHGLLGERLFTTDAWAGYDIVRFWPAQRVFLDDRYDMYPTRLVDDYTDVADGHPNWETVLDRYRVQVIVWPPARALSQLLAESSHWRRVHADATAVVYVRVGTVSSS